MSTDTLSRAHNEYNDRYGDSDVDNNNEYDDLSEGDGNDDDRRTIMTILILWWRL